jgi:hypothetical protein
MVNRIVFFASQHSIMFALFGFACGCLLYWLRERVKWLYAVIEILFGIGALHSAAPVTEGGSFSQSFGQFEFGGVTRVAIITVIGAVYLIVRGLDNWDKAMEKSRCWNRLRAKVGIPRP